MTTSSIERIHEHTQVTIEMDSQSPHLGSQGGTRRVWDFKITPLIADFGPEKDPLFREKRDFLPLKVTPYLMKTTNITSNMK